MKNIHLLSALLLVLIMLVIGVTVARENKLDYFEWDSRFEIEQDKEWTIQFNKNIDNSSVNSQTIVEAIKGISIVSAEYCEDVYYYEDNVEATVVLHNYEEEDKILWLGYSLLDPMGQYIDITPKKVKLSSKEETEVVVKFIPEKIVTGPYTAVFAVWDSFPIDEESIRITDIEIKEAFRVYAQKENFHQLDESFWKKRDATLGRTKLQPENVLTENEKLLIKLPAQTLYGGEIQTREELGFGSYEVKMKVPNAPSSITGFFLYKEPDYFYEIDIEIFNEAFNEAEAYIWFSTYADGKIQNEHKEFFDFDPTKDFHRYRFDYYPGEVSFYINDELVKSWSEGFSTESMRLMLNAWYPSWLDGIKPDEDKYLIVEWMRF